MTSLTHDGGNGRASEATEPARTQAALFAIVWSTLADVLGTAGVAAIVRRAARRAGAEAAELGELVVERHELDYRYAVPGGWALPDAGDAAALRVLAREIGRLLVELTGTVIVRLLEEVPALRARGLVWRMEDGR